MIKLQGDAWCKVTTLSSYPHKTRSKETVWEMCNEYYALAAKVAFKHFKLTILSHLKGPRHDLNENLEILFLIFNGKDGKYGYY